MQTTRPCIGICCVVGAMCFVTGILIGYFSRSVPTEPAQNSQRQQDYQGVDPAIKSQLLNELKAENIKQTLRHLTRKAHLAGTPADLETAEYVRDRWRENGLEVEIVPYEVLLSYPENNHNNSVSIVESNGNILYRTSAGDTFVRLTPDQSDSVQPFNGFSPSGSPQAELVYANYGRNSDFDTLHNAGINCTGKIVIARYGKIFRGNKAKAAHEAGAIGLIIYSDPADYLPSNNHTEVFPASWWLPGSGVQRGGLSMNKGDIETPGYPSTWYAYRLREDEANARLPQIPVHPIGYHDALPLLRAMLGPEAPDHFKGGLPIMYRLGPQMTFNRTVKMDIQNFRARRTTYNVIGKIRGAIEKGESFMATQTVNLIAHRYVLIGNHHDAWTQGAIDPSSGTATLTEMTRVFGQLHKSGWKPRRTLMFCSWGAEEYGMVGSIEWVEDQLRVLEKRAVAYVNVDSAVKGNRSFAGKAVPLLRNMLMKATKQVPDPHDPQKTVYDTWVENRPGLTAGQPRIKIPGSGSDYHGFIQIAGIPAVASQYKYDRGFSIASYPLYHTAYDVFSQMLLIDPTFECHRTVGRVNSLMLLELLDSVILPLDVPEYALTLVKLIDKVQETFGLLPGLVQRNITFDSMMSAAMNFTRTATAFQIHSKLVDKSNDLEIRMVNDRLMAVERMFIDPGGIHERKDIRHVAFAPSLTNNYAGVAFPGISDLLYKIQDDDDDRWEKVKKHISVITYAIQSAANLMAL